MKADLLHNNMELRSLNLEDLEQIANLHCRAFADSALTILGFLPVRKYYKWLMTGPFESYPVGVFCEGYLVGFCFAGFYSGSMKGYLKKYLPFLIFWIAIHPWLLFNPLILERVSLSVNVLRKGFPQRRSQVSISYTFGVLSIAVDTSRQGLGIGKRIMEEVEKNARNLGHKSIHLSVHPENISAVAFYENNGWKRIPDEFGMWHGVMEKEIF